MTSDDDTWGRWCCAKCGTKNHVPYILHGITDRHTGKCDDCGNRQTINVSTS